MSKYSIIRNSLFIILVFAAANTSAFVGPNSSAGSGGGFFKVDANYNIGFGTANPTPVSTFNASSTESGSSSFGYVFTIASTSNPGISIKNLTSGTGNTYIWSSRNFGNLQLYRESPTLPGYVVMDINSYGDVAIGQKATSTGAAAKLFVGGNIQATGSFIGSVSGNLSATNVTGPSAFGSSYGTYSYAFPGALAIGISTTAGLPAGGLYVVGNVGIGIADPGTNKLFVNGATYIEGNLALGANNISLTGNISNVNKLTVTTIDPLYEIGGVKYATYGASFAGGVKEEYVGRGKLAGGNAEYTIDFKGLEKGSDLWVWYRAVDFGKDNVEVLATAYGSPASIWYEIDGQKIIFHGSAPAEFSYRLVGKRHDWRNWPTFAKDQGEKPSFIIR